MPRPLNRKPPRRRARPAPNTEAEFDRLGTVNLDPDEKHQLVYDLIQRHAMERPQPTIGTRWAYRLGILASCIAVFSGWWLTLDVNTKWQEPSSSPGIVSTIKQSYDQVKTEQGDPVEKAKLMLQEPQMIQARQQIQSALLKVVADASSTSPSNP